MQNRIKILVLGIFITLLFWIFSSIQIRNKQIVLNFKYSLYNYTHPSGILNIVSHNYPALFVVGFVMIIGVVLIGASEKR